MSLEDLGSKLIASQCEPFTVCGSVLTINLQGRVFECGRRSDVNTARNDFTFCRVQSICTVSIRSHPRHFAIDLHEYSCHIPGTTYK